MESVKSSMLSTLLVYCPSQSHPIPYTFMYTQWEANSIISKQLIRNLGLAGAMIALVTLLLIADLVVCLSVLLCVTLTIIDIAGGAFFMGLTIEIVTSIILILSVGLSLDYSAHIGVSYVVSQEEDCDRTHRARGTLNSMGRAVANGGISTLFAFILVAFSNSYVFKTFFKASVQIYEMYLKQDQRGLEAEA